MTGENPTGSCYLWFVASFLLISIISGGIFLVLYLINPESPTASYFPVIGISLVCLPWFFWFITCSYRIISRKFGFRMVCWGSDVHPIDDAVEGGSMGGGSDGNSAIDNMNTKTGNGESKDPLTTSAES